MKPEVRLQEYSDTFSATPSILRPIPCMERGAEVLEELYARNVDTHDDELLDLLTQLSETYGEELIRLVAVKFGVVTSNAADFNSLFVMNAPTVAERILNRHRANPAEFKDALAQVAQEERLAAEQSKALDLHAFERETFHEIVELVALSGNPALEEVLKFAEDLDQVFEGHSYLFSYLENRYGGSMAEIKYTPASLAVQVALDYLTYREQYQIAIISDYERLLASGKTDPMASAISTANLQ